MATRIKLGTIECTQCTVLMGVFHQQKPEPILIGLDVVQDVCFLRSTQRAHRRCIAVDFNLTL